jgi:hypothetical protein
VLELAGSKVAHVVSFFDLSLFPTFGLPESLLARHQQLSL